MPESGPRPPSLSVLSPLSQARRRSAEGSGIGTRRVPLPNAAVPGLILPPGYVVTRVTRSGPLVTAHAYVPMTRCPSGATTNAVPT